MSTVANGPHVLRSMNRGAVLAVLRRGREPATVADLTRATALSRPAVTRAVADLEDLGLLERLEVTPDGGVGRPAQRLRFAADLGAVAGMHVSPNRVQVLVADLRGSIVADVMVETAPKADEVLAAAISALRKALDDLTPQAQLWGIGVGSPGLVDPETGSVRIAPSIPGWSEIQVAAKLQEAFACAVVIDNDVNLAALGEASDGAAQGLDDYAYVYWDDRVGAGLVLDGRPHRGVGMAAGELGFIDLVGDIDRPADPESQPSTDGAGRFERLVSMTAIAELAEQRAQADGDTGLLAELAEAGPGGALEALISAERSSPTARTVLAQAVARFCAGLAALVTIVDPGTVIVGGRAAEAGERLRALVAAELERRTLQTPTVLLSQLSDHAVALGALHRAGELVDQHLAERLG